MVALLVILAASPRVVVVSAWGEVEGTKRWSGAVLSPMACTTADAGLSDSPNCLAALPATATVTMLDGSTEKATSKKVARVSMTFCGDDDALCKQRPVWVKAPWKAVKKSEKAPTPEEDDQPPPVTAEELKAEVGFWPKDVATFPLVPGPKDAPLPAELPSLRAPPAKNPTGSGAPTPRTGNVVTFSVPGQSAPFQLISIGDAFAYKAPGAATFVWAGKARSSLRVHLLGAMDLDGNGVPEVVFGQQHAEGMTVFGIIELGPAPRAIGSYGEVAY